MEQFNFLRIAIMLGEGQAKTVKKNLAKIIKLVLCINNEIELSLNEIHNKIQESFSLTFSEIEIHEAIESNSNWFIIVEDSKDIYFKKYMVSLNEYNKYIKQNGIIRIESIVRKFIESRDTDFPFSESEFTIVLYNYLYEIFNSDIKMVLSLLNYKGAKPNFDYQSDKFTNEEIEWINKFLDWDNEDKNKLVYMLISSSFEYCMMTVKKNNSSFAEVFKGKEFYIDSNIIFRLAGINNDSRKKVVEAFISKCRECGITIKYTNFTNLEIEETINYYVKKLKKILGEQNNKLISIESMSVLMPRDAKLDFYKIYTAWVNKGYNRLNNFEEFKVYLLKEVQTHLNSMTFERFSTFKGIKKEKFDSLIEDFTEYKRSRNKDIYTGAIEKDIENYLYMRHLERNVQSNSFVDKKNYFITADHCYMNWANNQTPGAIPTYVLPSIWYSIMLKYSGRTDNDYNAFCQFINLRVSVERDELVKKKEEMLAYVLSLPEDSKIKEEIIYDIGHRLNDENKIDTEDVEVFVQTVYDNVTSKKINEALEEKNEEHRKQINGIHKEYISKLDNLNSTVKSEVEQAKSRGREEGEENLKTKMIEGRVNQIKLRNIKIRKAVDLVFFVSLVLFVVSLLIIPNPFINNIITKKLDGSPTLLLLVSSGISSIFKFNIKNINWLTIDDKIIRDKIIKKYDKLNI